MARENDYGRAHISGSQGHFRWESLLHEDGLEGWEAGDSPWTPTAWSRDENTVVANVTRGDQARLLQGNTNWMHYELKVQGTLVKGSNVQIQFRISEDGRSFYFRDFLTGWKAMAISKVDGKSGETTKLDVVNFIFEGGREYDIVIAARGHSLTSYIDGNLVNRVADASNPSGSIALCVWGRLTVARFREPKIRHYFKKR